MRFLHFVVAMVGSAAFWVTRAEAPQLISFYLMGVTAIAFILFCFDKLMAAQGLLRVPERLLLLLVALGGIVGGSAAQALVNHKVSKPTFQLRYAVSSVIALVLLWVLLKP
jgi:uncharacterized membrane protein YsdA (DUF1294 family)